MSKSSPLSTSVAIAGRLHFCFALMKEICLQVLACGADRLTIAFHGDHLSMSWLYCGTKSVKGMCSGRCAIQSRVHLMSSSADQHFRPRTGQASEYGGKVSCCTLNGFPGQHSPFPKDYSNAGSAWFRPFSSRSPNDSPSLRMTSKQPLRPGFTIAYLSPPQLQRTR